MATRGRKRKTDEPKNPLTLPEAAEAIIARAAALSRAEIVRLDIAERRNPQDTRRAWAALSDELDSAGLTAERFAARNRSWAAVRASIDALEIDPTPDDPFWHLTAQIGAGAARAARYAACALVAPERIDDETATLLLEPWESVMGPAAPVATA